MNGIGIVEKAIKNAVEEYASELQTELTEKYTEEFERKLKAKRMEITANVVGSLVVEGDPRTMQIVIHIR